MDCGYKKHPDVASHPHQAERSKLFIRRLIDIIRQRTGDDVGILCAGARHINDAYEIIQSDPDFQNFGAVVFESKSYNAEDEK
jgi:hypothetical protein